MSALTEWESFYVIVGAAAGALIGLQFVVMTLIAERPPLRVAEASTAFATPTVVHFSVVLLVSALLSVPWSAITSLTALCGLIGLGGMAYVFLTARRMRVQSTYKPVFEDWLFHALLPLVGYLILAISALADLSHIHEALFAIGGAALLLLFCGIHNAWDAVAYHVSVSRRQRDDEAE